MLPLCSQHCLCSPPLLLSPPQVLLALRRGPPAPARPASAGPNGAARLSDPHAAMQHVPYRDSPLTKWLQDVLSHASYVMVRAWLFPLLLWFRSRCRFTRATSRRAQRLASLAAILAIFCMIKTGVGCPYGMPLEPATASWAQQLSVSAVLLLLLLLLSCAAVQGRRPRQIDAATQPVATVAASHHIAGRRVPVHTLPHAQRSP